MRKILSVIKREYVQIVRTKGFIIGTILGPVFMLGLLVVPILVQTAAVEEQKTIGVVDLTYEVFSGLDKRLAQSQFKLQDGSRKYVLKEFKPIAGFDKLRNELRQRVLDNELSAYILIPAEVLQVEEAENADESSGEEEIRADFFSKHTTDFQEIGDIRSAINRVIVEKRLKKGGLDPQKIAQYTRRVDLRTIKVTKRGEEEDTAGTFMISYFLGLIIYMAILIYGQVIMRGVIEEKSSKVVEVILSSLKPFQLMMGKILGIGAVGLTQFAVWTLFGVGASLYSASFIAASPDFSLPSIPPHIFIYLMVFFILGYFLFATLYAAIGSMVNNEKEAQNLVFPVMMFLIIPIMLMIWIIRSPNSSLSVILSLVPFFAPILMFLRINVLLPPFWQIAASLLILVLTILFMIWLVSKVYRVGILMYGKRPSFQEVVKWIRYR